MFDHEPNEDETRKILQEVAVLRRPYVGIVSGYHELRYRVLGPAADGKPGSVQISGRLFVSPKLIWTPAQVQKTFGEIFQEKELMEATLVSRVFAFPAVIRGSFSVESTHLKVGRHEWSPDVLAEKILDELTRREITDTAVLRIPNIRFYPLAIQRFIHEILVDEFS